MMRSSLRIAVIMTGKNGFLPDVEVAETTEFLHGVELTGLLLEAAHQHHLLEPTQVGVLVEGPGLPGGVFLFPGLG